MKIKDRIKELRRVKASELMPNPKNWRTHPVSQSNALKGILADVGFADAVIARETPDGLMLLDGHLRTEVATDTEIPVLIVDLNDEEADKVLATFDPLGAMANIDKLAFDDLIKNMETSTIVNDLLKAISDSYQSLELNKVIGDVVLNYGEEIAGDDSDQLTNQFEIVITCNNEQHQKKLLEQLTDGGLECRSLIS
jgi:hypothetical protein